MMHLLLTSTQLSPQVVSFFLILLRCVIWFWWWDGFYDDDDTNYEDDKEPEQWSATMWAACWWQRWFRPGVHLWPQSCTWLVDKYFCNFNHTYQHLPPWSLAALSALYLPLLFRIWRQTTLTTLNTLITRTLNLNLNLTQKLIWRAKIVISGQLHTFAMFYLLLPGLTLFHLPSHTSPSSTCQRPE